MNLTLRSFLLLITVLLFACAADYDAYPDAPSSGTASCRKVEMYGDSITHQAGQTIEEFLPCYTVTNHGSDGTMAYQMPIPPWDKETVYTVSYGTNECLNSVSIESYRLSLNHILNAGRGQRIVLEAPWLVVDPRCNPNIDQYRAVVVDLGKLYGVPVAVLNVNQDHIGEGIHLTQAHMRERARLLAAEVLKL
jgi:hypothetical protein